VKGRGPSQCVPRGGERGWPDGAAVGEEVAPAGNQDLTAVGAGGARREQGIEGG
jgi:hypothetical protein